MNQQRSFIQAAVAALALAAALPAFAETRLEVQTVRHPYVYYRDHDIYYSPETRTWFWRADGTWLSGPALPRESEVYVKAGGIKVELDTERPYERHDYVVTHYRNAPAPVTERTVTESSPDRQVTTERTVTETVPGRTEERTVTTTTTKHRYVYYADREVYFAPETRTWYWMADGTWRSGPTLPVESQTYVRSGGVNIELDTVRPYERHSYVVAKYKNKLHRHHDRDEDEDEHEEEHEDDDD